MDRSQRIPKALQNVFVASNCGEEVHTPPEKVANTVFVRSWVNKPCPESPQKTPSKKMGTPLSTLFEESRGKMDAFGKNIPDGNPRLGQHGRRTRRPSFMERAKCAPQMLLDEHMVSRGYSIDSYQTLHTAYYKSPTRLQEASYGPYMIRLVKEGDAEGLRAALQTGLSPNPCNQYGESLVHMACRRGDISVLNALLEAGASVQVADDYGRTPMHDACWAAKPAFEVVEAILKLDNRLFYMKDCRGSLPLAYVHRDHFDDWSAFLSEKVVPVYFPHENATSSPPELCKSGPNAYPLIPPKHPLPYELAILLANGKMSPAEVLIMTQDDPTASDESDTEYDSEYDDDSDCDSQNSDPTENYSGHDHDDLPTVEKPLSLGTSRLFKGLWSGDFLDM